MRISDWSSDVCSSDLDRTVLERDAHVVDPDRQRGAAAVLAVAERAEIVAADPDRGDHPAAEAREPGVAVVVGRAGLAGHVLAAEHPGGGAGDRKGTRLNSSH